MVGIVPTAIRGSRRLRVGDRVRSNEASSMFSNASATIVSAEGRGTRGSRIRRRCQRRGVDRFIVSRRRLPDPGLPELYVSRPDAGRRP